MLSLVSLLFTPSAEAATKTMTVKGVHGESLSATPSSLSQSGLIKVQGSHFDETVGIYLAFCVLPKKGELPTPCGGGINKAGIAAISFWISSNPPPYGIGLAEEFLPGGRFTHSIRISPMIGKFDCRKVKCAITVRADHTRDGDRSYDMFIPITFQLKK
jgi:hypothetical protein